MSFKNLTFMFALRVVSVKNDPTQFGAWPDDCPIWLQDVLDTTLSEFDNSRLEIEKLLQAFIDKNDYVQLRIMLEKADWFIDSYGKLRATDSNSKCNR